MSDFLLVIPEDVIKGCSKADKLVVTGEFDNWRHSDYVLQYDGSTQNYRVQIPRRKGQRSTMFKVVINDKKWVTLNYFDTVTDKSGYTNNILHFKDNEASQLMDIPLSPHTRSNTAKGKPEDDSLNDYVNLSSHSDLSSTEEIVCWNSDMEDENMDATIQCDFHQAFNSRKESLNGLMCIAKKVKTYGLDIHIFNRFIPFHLYHKVSISFRGIIIAVSRRGTQAPTDNGKRSGIITTYVKEEDQFKKGKGRGLRIGTLQATKRLIDSSYEALFLSIYCLSSSK
ncbi:BAK_1a_G0026690.mRNA.1.CDS.1 [Saccharomyces cerevisiae]|nr:BAK_1a_G0026690.mRNA.1.CDS.1 [Saccharomyces cerevisiae]CAI7092080.1 BAK_1a_G0026690.mRNA.1.CDS.1 [Saccharomyces cerevisiae]